jgi:predicted nucleotidyltransferase
MFSEILISKVDQKILRFLAKYSDKEYHERDIVRRIGASSGATNRALNQLFSTGAIKRREEWRMLFYSIDQASPALIQFKILVNILLLEPLVAELKSYSSRIMLYGSCARGQDTSKSDLDVFIVTSNRENVTALITDFHFPKGFDEIHIQAVIKSPIDLIKVGQSEQVFLDEVEQGITLWDKRANEL